MLQVLFSRIVGAFIQLLKVICGFVCVSMGKIERDSEGLGLENSAVQVLFPTSAGVVSGCVALAANTCPLRRWGQFLLSTGSSG